MKFWFFLFTIFSILKTSAQTLGGNAVFNFLNQPNSAQVSALGGINISNITSDVGMTFHNPSILRKQMSRQVDASFNAFVGGIKNYSLTTSYFSESLNTSFGFGLNYFNYGNIIQADASGNELGTFKPTEYVVQFSAAKQYNTNWFYGATLKLMQSQFAQFNSNGLALDVGVTYYDSAANLQASVIVKNMGTQLKKYDAGKEEELPFDLQAGITKRLAKAPLQFSLTAHNLHRFNIYYNDTAFLAEEGSENFRGKKFTFQKLFSHFVIGAQANLNDKVEVSTGYNFQRRNDLNIFNSTNGLSGFTLGAGLLLKNLQARFATGFYQQNTFNQFSINFKL